MIISSCDNTGKLLLDVHSDTDLLDSTDNEDNHENDTEQDPSHKSSSKLPTYQHNSPNIHDTSNC